MYSRCLHCPDWVNPDRGRGLADAGATWAAHLVDAHGGAVAPRLEPEVAVFGATAAGYFVGINLPEVAEVADADLVEVARERAGLTVDLVAAAEVERRTSTYAMVRLTPAGPHATNVRRRPTEVAVLVSFVGSTPADRLVEVALQAAGLTRSGIHGSLVRPAGADTVRVALWLD